MTGTMSLQFILVVNLSLLSSFKRAPPPHKLFSMSNCSSSALEVARKWTKFLSVTFMAELKKGSFK